MIISASTCKKNQPISITPSVQNVAVMQFFVGDEWIERISPLYIAYVTVMNLNISSIINGFFLAISTGRIQDIFFTGVVVVVRTTCNNPMLSNVFMFPMIQTRYLFLKVLVISRTIFLVISGECIYVSPESWSEHTRCRTPYFGDLQMLTTWLKSCYITRITLQGFSYSNWFVFYGNLINFRYC